MTDTKWPLNLGTTSDGDPIVLPIEAMLRHVVALGSSGSGKTVMCKVIVEEAVRKGLPVICIDPQGDLASLGRCADLATLEKYGVDPHIASDYHSKVDLKVWTPGSSQGIPVNISPNLSVAANVDAESRLRAYGSIAESLAGMAGYSATSEIGEAAKVCFETILEYADDNGLLIEDMNDFSDFLRDPPAALLERIDPIFSAGDRSKAEKKFRLKMMGSSRLLFDLGNPINVDALFGYETGGAYDQGKVRVSVIYLNMLNTFEEKALFVSMLCNALYQWMLQEASKLPVGMLYMDEVAPYMPPVRKPPSKPALMLLLRQARKYGVCCMFATQSPGDLDYKGLSQVGTWLLGKVSTRQELAKVAPALRAEAGVDVGVIADALPAYRPGQFAIINADHFEGPQEFQSRWLVSRHEWVSGEDVQSMVSDLDREIYGK